MTYEEFKKKIELATGVSLMWKDTTNYKMLCEKGVDCELLTVNKNKGHERHFKINTMHINALLNLYNDNNYESFLKWLFELVETPAEEREQQPRYYLKHKYLCNCESYLYISTFDGSLRLGFKYNAQKYQNTFKNTFTAQEIENLKLEYCTNLYDFELIPAEKEEE